MQIPNTTIYQCLLSRFGSWIRQWSRFHHFEFIPHISQKTTHKNVTSKIYNKTTDRQYICTTLQCTQNFTHDARLSVTENQLSRSVFRQSAIRTPVGRSFNVSSAPPIHDPLKMVTTSISRHMASHSRRVLSFSTIPFAVHKQPLSQTKRMWTHRRADKNNLMHFTSQETHILVTGFHCRQYGAFKTKLL